MRRTGRIGNRDRPRGTVGVSLFPFLAVLICTMGALILLLIVIARQARLQAAQTARAAAAEDAQQQEDFQAQRDMARWRIEQLHGSRRQTESQLAEARLHLGHIEDHARRLRDQLARLQATYRDLERLGSDGSRQRDQLERELARLQAEIAEAERRLADARRAARQRSRSYAVVPYHGPYQTRRRPIYIECGARTITVQPEGVVLSEEDFEGPMGPGNPLAAALRAAREYLLTHGDFDPEQSGEPYPLLLVRPDGIPAYYAARAAMKSWGSEFGYELIGADWTLDFRQPDQQLAEVVRRAVDTARARQQRLAAAAPRHYRQAERAKYRAAPTRGGVVRDGGSFGGGDSGFYPRRPAGGFGSLREPTGSSRSQQTPRADGTRNDESSPAGTGNEGSTHAGTGHEGATDAGTPASGAPRERPQSSPGHGDDAPRPGEWQPGRTTAAESQVAGRPGRQAESLAKTRGRDWALPEAATGSVPITRPIRIDCYPDRLVIVPEQGLAGGKTVPLGAGVEASIDELRSAVWEYMDSWGIAGQGMYWRPILNVYVAPHAEQRFDEFSTLLEDSGLTVRRKQ